MAKAGMVRGGTRPGGPSCLRLTVSAGQAAYRQVSIASIGSYRWAHRRQPGQVWSGVGAGQAAGSPRQQWSGVAAGPPLGLPAVQNSKTLRH